MLRHAGEGFDVTATPDPKSADRLMRSGGRGVFLINELMDEVRYSDGGREVRMCKRGS